MSSVKRENSGIILSSNNVILDIEGTTTSITFVKDVLFPYVRKHLEAYVKGNWNTENFQAVISALRTQAKEDKQKNLDGFVDILEGDVKDDLLASVINNVLWQMDLDSKAKSLKDLQGLIMEDGYKKGELKGHVYEDVEPSLKLWTDLGKSVYIYSSGSVHAQKLLFGHTEKGDLLQFIKGHFDTTVGKKTDVESYQKIIELISGSPSETVFFTDVPKEARAAKDAGLLAILLSREGNVPLTEEDKNEFQVLTSFSEVQFESNLKKRKVCTISDNNDDNKTVESCEVSIKTPKEVTNPTLTLQHDGKMEVEDNFIEDKTSDEMCTSENLEEKNVQKDVVTTNGDVAMKPTNVTEEEITKNDVDIKPTNVIEEEVTKSDDEIKPTNITEEEITKNNDVEITSTNVTEEEITKNNDVEMKPADVPEEQSTKSDSNKTKLTVIDDKIENEKVDCDNGALTKDNLKNGDVVPNKMDLQNTKMEINEHPGGDKILIGNKSNQFSDDCQEKLETTVESSESDNAKVVSERCEDKTCLENNKDTKESKEIEKKVNTSGDETVNQSSIKEINDVDILVQEKQDSGPNQLDDLKAHPNENGSSEESKSVHLSTNGNSSPSKKILNTTGNDLKVDSVRINLPLHNGTKMDEMKFESSKESKVEINEAVLSDSCANLPQVETAVKTSLETLVETKNDGSSLNKAVEESKGMETDEGNIQTTEEEAECKVYPKAAEQPCEKSEEKTHCDDTNKTITNKSNSFASNSPNKVETLAKKNDEPAKQSQLTKETFPHHEVITSADINVNEDSCQLSEQQGKKPSSEDKCHETKNLESIEDKMKNKINAIQVDEVKVCEVPETSAITAVVEA